VTKEYNVGLPDQSYRSGRFILVSEDRLDEHHEKGRLQVYGDIALAEEVAKTYVHHSFSLESYYLQIRTYVGLGE